MVEPKGPALEAPTVIVPLVGVHVPEAAAIGDLIHADLGARDHGPRGPIPVDRGQLRVWIVKGRAVVAQPLRVPGTHPGSSLDVHLPALLLENAVGGEEAGHPLDLAVIEAGAVVRRQSAESVEILEALQAC